MKKYGYDWQKSDDGLTAHDGRFFLQTWKFGTIHQCVVDVAYNHPINGQPHVGVRGRVVRFLLKAQKTRDDAMKRATFWVEDYVKNGPPSSEDLFKDLYTEYKSLYRCRADIINQLFFTLGGGYDWLDGKIVNTAVDWKLERFERKNHDEDWMRRARELQEASLEVGPLEDNGASLSFYPVSEDYSNVCLVPDDVTDEWLAIAFEAATMLATRSGVPDDENNEKDFGDFILDALVEKTNKIGNMERDEMKPLMAPKKRSMRKKIFADKKLEEVQRQLENKRIGKKYVAELKARFGDRIK